MFRSKGLLDEFYQDPEETTFYDDEGNAYWVRKEKDGYWAYPKSADSLCKIKLSDDDLQLVRFENLVFAQELKKKNKLTGSSSELTKRMFVVGRHKVLATDVSVILGFFDNDKIAEKELLSLPARIPEAKTFLVLSHSYSPDSANLSMIFSDKRILCRKFEDASNNDFIINFDCIPQRDFDKGFQIPAIRQNEKGGYKEHGYKRQDIIEFMQEEVGNRLVRLKINDNPPVDIRYSEVALLMLMAIKLKTNSGGWISFNDVLKDGIIHCEQGILANKKDADDLARFHRLVSDVRKIFNRFQCKDLLEGIRGKSQYRISTHPNRIKEPGSNWLKRTYKNTILPALKSAREGKND